MIFLASVGLCIRTQSDAFAVDGEVKQNIVVNEQLAMLPDIEDQIFSNLGREAKPYEIADILGISLNI